MHPTATMLLASLDHTLATVRAALAAASDPEQPEETRSELAARAGADIARLVASSRDTEWRDVPPATWESIDRAGTAASRGDLTAAERDLTDARERLGGPSR